MQLSRIVDNENYTTQSRINLARRIANKYIGNITKQRDYQRDIRDMYASYEQGDFQKVRNLQRKTREKQYTPRVYQEGNSIG